MPTIVLIACQSSTCTASQPRHVARQLEAVFDAPSLPIHATDAHGIGFGFYRPVRDQPPWLQGAVEHLHLLKPEGFAQDLVFPLAWATHFTVIRALKGAARDFHLDGSLLRKNLLS